jgi:glutathione S-transferase
VSGAVRVLRIPFSTNVERVALAAAHKGVPIEWEDVDPGDRSAVLALTGQELVPVMVAPDGRAVADSMAILALLEAQAPDPPLWPADPATRAMAEIAVDWFNAVWKVAPNAIDEALASERPGDARIAAWSRQMRDSLPLFEGLLSGRDFLLGDALGVLDVVAFPFLKYGTIEPEPGDEEPFHHILHEHLAQTRSFPALTAWIARLDALPRA